MDNNELKQALDDINIIKRILKKSEDSLSYDSSGGKVNLMLQSLAFISAFLVLVIELVYEEPNRFAFMYSKIDNNFMWYGLTNAGIILLAGAIFFFSCVSQAALNDKKEITPYIAKNFSYLKKMTFFSDLLIKFAIFSLVIIYKAPELVPVLFLVFTADYLFQSRFFLIPFKLEIGLAFMCLALAAIQVWYQSPTLIIALAAFCAVSTISLFFSFKEFNQKKG